MTQAIQNSYLQRYQQKQQTQNSRSLSKSNAKGTSSPQVEVIQANQIGNTVGKLSQRVDGIELKLTSLVNVVKLLQKYTQTRDDQYEKEKENNLNRKSNQDGGCSTHCNQMEIRVKQFDILTRQFKDQLRNIESLKNTMRFVPQNKHKFEQQQQQSFEATLIEELQQRLRAEINKKMQICVKLITSNSQPKQSKLLSDKVNEISFNLNQLENQCRRNKMMFEKQVDNLASLLKQGSTQIPNNHSRITENQINSKHSFQPPLRNSKSRNSKSDKSISRGKQNRSVVMLQIPKEASRIREDELKEALRKKKEHREKLKVKNW